MGYEVRRRSAPGQSGPYGTLYTLRGPQGDEAEIWPGLGFNVFRWFAAGAERLYADPELFSGSRPTRSGVPILFPFPNRIRDGRFTWDGVEYVLPANDPAQRNAIHGFGCRSVWRVVDQGANTECAWLTGEFRASVDVEGWHRGLWPADHAMRLTVRLSRGTLRFEATVSNPDSVPLPFGLGYHPYFLAGPDTLVECPAARYWPLQANLPTGEPISVEGARDLNRPRPLSELQLDDLLTDLPARAARVDGLIERGTLYTSAGTLRLFASPAFREMVVFTPPHRQAICLEPYTCTTDAVNLAALGYDTGWQVLNPARDGPATWSAVMEFWL
ncbi:MAG: aldose 1-epimerase [Gemmataceae bacterium]